VSISFFHPGYVVELSLGFNVSPAACCHLPPLVFRFVRDPSGLLG